MNGDVDFVGCGIAFPIRVNARGGIALASGAEEIDGSLRAILATAPGERLMRPEFGCEIWNQLFATVDPNTLGLMAQAVRQAILRWEPRVELEEVLAVPDQEDADRVQILLTYVIKATNDRRNLVFPFYVLREEGPS